MTDIEIEKFCDFDMTHLVKRFIKHHDMTGHDPASIVMPPHYWIKLYSEAGELKDIDFENKRIFGIQVYFNPSDTNYNEKLKAKEIQEKNLFGED